MYVCVCLCVFVGGREGEEWAGGGEGGGGGTLHYLTFCLICVIVFSQYFDITCASMIVRIDNEKTN